MNNLSKLSNKAKTLILIGVVLLLLILSAVTFLITDSLTNNTKLKGYGNTPYDDNMTVSLSVLEKRKSSLHDNNKLNGLENQNYDFVVFVTKPLVPGYSLVVKYMSLNLVVRAQDKELYYESAKKGSMSHDFSTAMSKGNTSTCFTLSNVVSKEFAKDSKSVTDIDQTPETVYLDVFYVLKKTNNQTNVTESIEKNIKYEVKIDDLQKFDYQELPEGSITRETSDTVISKLAADDPFNLRIKYEPNKGTSSDREYYEDKIELTLRVNSAIINKNAKIKFNVIGKVENDKADTDNLFPEMVRIGSYYGFLPKSDITLYSIKNELDTNYNLSDIYIFSTITLEGGETIKLNYLLNTVNF